MINNVFNFMIKAISALGCGGVFVNILLRLHNFSYRLSGNVGELLEPDGLHPKHRLMNYHKWFMDKLKKDWSVLDIGCGNGALAYDLIDSCGKLTAIDINPGNISKAKEQFSKKGIDYIIADATKYDFEEMFDAIVLSNVLEHIEDRVGFLKLIYAKQNKITPPVLLLRVPMLNREWITLYKKERGIEYRLDKTHFIEYTLDSLRDELESADMKIDSFDIMFGEFYGIIKHK